MVKTPRSMCTICHRGRYNAVKRRSSHHASLPICYQRLFKKLLTIIVRRLRVQHGLHACGYAKTVAISYLAAITLTKMRNYTSRTSHRTICTDSSFFTIWNSFLFDNHNSICQTSNFQNCLYSGHSSDQKGNDEPKGISAFCASISAMILLKLFPTFLNSNWSLDWNCCLWSVTCIFTRAFPFSIFTHNNWSSSVEFINLVFEVPASNGADSAICHWVCSISRSGVVHRAKDFKSYLTSL